MTQQSPAPDRRKLALILALLVSDKPGERDAAARPMQNCARRGDVVERP
jgi:hypothetical protein